MILGVIRQEILSWVRDSKQFDRLQAALAAFVVEPVTSEDHVEAARLCNQGRSAGIVTGNTDCLLCAVAKRRKWEIFSTDKDFTFIATIVPIQLFEMH